MRIAIVAPPFIPVPPVAYGGTELFVAQLAKALVSGGHHVLVYANGESRVRCDLRWLYPNGDWPPVDPTAAHLKNVDHTAWAIRDAAQSAAVVNPNDVIGLPFTRFVDVPVVLTMHHPREPVLAAMYGRYTRVEYVAISDAQARGEPMPLFDASAAMHAYRLPELLCGFRRRPGEGPTLYPVACSPQAWASGVVFQLIQACTGFSVDVAGSRVVLHRPILPPFLSYLKFTNLGLPFGVVDLLFERDRDDVTVTTLRQSGEFQIEVCR